MARASHISEVFLALHVDVIAAKVHEPHKMIRDSYSVPKYAADDYDEARQILSDYYKLHYTKWLEITTELPDDYAYGFMRTILDKDHGGFVLAIKNAIRGRDGGLVNLCDLIRDDFIKQSEEKYIRYVIDELINLLDYDQILEFAKQYLELYGECLLDGDKPMTHYELAADLDSLIPFHLNLLEAFKRKVT